MKMNSKRIGFILLGIALLISLGFWIIACLFAESIASFVAAVRAKSKE